MAELASILSRCPSSDAAQRGLLMQTYGLDTLDALRGAVVFGAGLLGEAMAARLGELGLAPRAISDNNPERWGGVHAGLPIIAPDAIVPDTPVIVASKYVKDIFRGLQDRGFSRLIPHYLLPICFPGSFTGDYHFLSASQVCGAREQIAKVFSLFKDEESGALFLQLLKFRITLNPLDLPDPVGEQYFPTSFWPKNGNEIYVDVGACSGDTLADFLHFYRSEFAKYYAIEPDPANYEALKNAIPSQSAGEILPKFLGVGRARGSVKFASGKGGESKISGEGDITVPILPLSEIVGGDPVSSIKIDTEGYELEVLEGALEIIRKHAPKLAVSVYHKLPDLWELPLWIDELGIDYSYYLRHHTPEIYDTVLYCLPKEVPTT